MALAGFAVGEYPRAGHEVDTDEVQTTDSLTLDDWHVRIPCFEMTIITQSNCNATLAM